MVGLAIITVALTTFQSRFVDSNGTSFLADSTAVQAIDSDVGDSAGTIATANGVVEPAVTSPSQVPEALAFSDDSNLDEGTASQEPAAENATEEPTDSATADASTGGEQEEETQEIDASGATDEPESVDATEESTGDLAEGLVTSEDAWTVLTGDWEVVDGQMIQTRSEGFDYITQLTEETPSEYSIAVSLEALSSELGAGLILGQPNIGSRRGAWIVDFADGGSFLRWGRYAPESGIYTYIGGLNVGADPGDVQDLRIEVKADTTLVYLQDTYIGAFEPIESGGVGLVTSQSSVAFSDLTVESLS